jgi:hypothetical protein
VGTIADIASYLEQARSAQVRLQKFTRFVVLSVHTESSNAPLCPLTVRLTAPWKIVRVKGSLVDGIYNLRRGELLLDVLPGQEVIVENLQPEAGAGGHTARKGSQTVRIQKVIYKW